MYPQDFERLSRTDKENEDRDHARRVFASLLSVEFNALSPEDIAKFHDKLNAPPKRREDILRKLPK